MMINAILLIRCIFFALLILLSLLTLAFAAWSVNASMEAKQAATTAGLIVFESCLFLLLVALSSIEIIKPNFPSTRLSFECGWVALMAFFQLGEAISATINSSVSACRSGSTKDICASSALLVPTSWLKSLLTFAYFFILFITVLAHREVYDNIWKETVYTVAWLESGVDRAITRVDQDLEKAKTKRSAKNWDSQSGYSDEDPYGGYDLDTASARVRRFLSVKPRDEPAPWAKQAAPIKRGVDQPFSRTNTPAGTPALLPTKPLPPAPLNPGGVKSNTSSRFIEKFRESKILSRFELPSLYGSHFMSSFNNNGAPPGVLSPTSPQPDMDKPIPLPPTSQWVRAEDIRR